MSRLQWTKQYVDNHVSNILKQQKDEKQVSHDIRQIFSGRGMLRNYLNQTLTVALLLALTLFLTLTKP